MKLRVLACTEVSYLSTGYAVYIREIFKRLHATQKYELAELACYAAPGDSKLQQIPWKVYPNLPSNEEERKVYESNVINPFGAWKFESTCLDFKPHVVFIYRDHWFDAFAVNSPYRKYYNLLWMPACDGYPQAKQWIADYCTADAISTYSDWAIEVLQHQANNSLNIIGSTSPAADESFQPVENRKEHKAKYGLENMMIVGTVMRNQRRKLFPDLFQSFRTFLDQSGRKDVLLYCHTGYPDRNPWNIPELINDYGLSNKVILTYRCNPNRGGCGFAFPSFFSDFVKICPHCRKLTATTADYQNGVDNNFLKDIYNLFDVYIQYANMEACGMPQIEAAACGVPLMAVDYAGMGDIVKKVEGIPLPPLTMSKEIETGRFMAVPDNNWTANKFDEFFSLTEEDRDAWRRKTRENYLKHFGYEKSAAKFAKYFDSLNPEELNKKWNSPPDLHQVPDLTREHIERLSTLDFTKWLILDVMREPSLLGSYFHSRLIKDINYGCSTNGIGGIYMNDNAFMFGDNALHDFKHENAYQLCRQIRDNKNYWESIRAKS